MSKDLITSLSLVSIISVIGAGGFSLLGHSFFAVFLILWAVQFIIFSFLVNVVNNYFTQKTLQKELDVLDPLSTILECAYCKTPNVMIFLPDQNERLEFQCSNCKKTNLVNIQFVVARTTEPVTPANVPLNEN